MGKRSRKRVADGSAGDGSTRAERDAARRERARLAREGAKAKARATPARQRGVRPSAEDRPPPFWAPFPLTELLTLAGIVLMIWGFVSGVDEGGDKKIAAGLAIASIGGLELALREHLTGFRSHSTLLAGAVGILAIVAAALGLGLDTLGPLLIVGALAFGGAFYGFRELFKRKSGGLAFR
jgi:hypothetical protein